ncbi:MAG TPA: glutaredoxin domain-containing protein [Candidatus Kapabacteria bacterium]|nr:glutaredoxin domain-containing protein [Candidatus Kapabacteria bacterium]
MDVNAMCGWTGRADRLRIWLLGLFWVVSLLLPGASALADETDGQSLTVFVRTGCPHCADAKEFLAQLQLQRPELQIVYRAVDQDTDARAELLRISRANGLWPPGVPTFVIDGRVRVGFGDPQKSGPELVAFIDQDAAPVQVVETALFGTLNVSQLGLPLFTLALGLLDGFNPCATWVLLFLLSLLVRMKDRARIALVAGTFVLVSGAVYYAFMAAWLNVFLLVGMSNALRIGLAVLALLMGAVNVKDFIAFKKGISLSIPESAKPGLYARMRRVMQADALSASLLAVTALAVVVNFVELLCTAGLPAIYTAVLAQQGVSTAGHYAYLALYILAYMADDALMVAIAVIALGSNKMTETTGRWLKLLSGSVMVALGVVMLLKPDWLM